MITALWAGPGAVAGLSLVLLVPTRLERLIASSGRASSPTHSEPAGRVEGPPVVGMIGVRERNPACTSA